MHSGKVLYGSHGGVQVLRFLGRVTYQIGPALRRFVDKLFLGPTPTGFVIDLTETQSIDSTNLGLLAHIANRMREKGGPRVTIVSGVEDINDILLSMGFDEVFDIVAEIKGPCGTDQPIVATETDGATLRQTILEAHRCLMALNERNRDQFADVVKLLEAQDGDA